MFKFRECFVRNMENFLLCIEMNCISGWQLKYRIINHITGYEKFDKILNKYKK